MSSKHWFEFESESWLNRIDADRMVNVACIPDIHKMNAFKTNAPQLKTIYCRSLLINLIK